jgi:DNA-binding LacI/PurR family transcriptional regulator
MTSTIGIVSTVQDIKFFTQGYFRTLLGAAGRVTVGRDCVLRLVSLAQDEFGDLQSARALLVAQRCDALLVVAPHEIFLPTIAGLCAELPGVIVSPPRLDLGVSYVCSDNRGIMAHLAARGRRRVTLVQPAVPSGDFYEREIGYREGAAAAGIVLEVALLDYPLTETIFDQVIQARPDAIIAPSDDDALPILARMRRFGLRVPQDIALSGFDDEDFAVETDPPLTTVRQPVEALAEHATRYLLDRLDGIDRGLYQEVLPNTLIVRGST